MTAFTGFYISVAIAYQPRKSSGKGNITIKEGGYYKKRPQMTHSSSDN